jgi:acetyl-CoA C-acetyltransferase
MTAVVIASAARTPLGSFQGALSSITAPKLGAVAITAALERAGLNPDQVDEVLMGCVLPAGVGQAPARQAAIFAGLSQSTPCTTLNKVCGSGLKAVMMAAQAIKAGDADIVVAGGMESMSNAPYLLPKARTGYRMGHGELVDSMVKDGLWDVYNDYHMGIAGELCATECNVPRDRQDAFAIESYRRANEAIAAGKFTAEIAPVSVPQRKGDPKVIDTDEEPGRGRPDKIPALRSVFKKDATITAANASSINDGAAAVVVMSKAKAEELGIDYIAEIVGYGQHAQAPEWFTTAPAYAIQKTLDKVGLAVDAIDLWEVNEAFSVVSLAVEDKVGYSADDVNVWGGAVALGHPIGASGCRILVTLLHQLMDRSASLGCASLCIGGGEAVAMVVKNAKN